MLGTALELLQMGISLRMGSLAVAAGRLILSRIDTVCQTDAFLDSGMSRRDLIVVALQAVVDNSYTEEA